MADALEEARLLIYGHRQREYGEPRLSLGKIAELWAAYLGVPVTARDVAAMMILMKVARGGGKRDNWVDICGYAAIAADRLGPNWTESAPPEQPTCSL